MHGPFWQKVGKKDMREKWFREHIWWMSFILSLMVVWVHSENVDLFLGEIGRESLVYRLEFFFAQTLGQIAVPGFFICFVEYSLLSGLRCSHKAFFCEKDHWKRAGCFWFKRTVSGGSIL